MLRTILKSYLRSCRVVTGTQYATCPPSALNDPNIVVSMLENGVRIVTEETSSPLTCVSLCVAVGPRFESRPCHGLTHFVEHMAYQGFFKIAKTQFEENIRTMGAKFTTKTDREIQIFSMTLPSSQAVSAVENFFNIITELDLNECTLARQRYYMDLESKQVDNDPRAVVFNFLHEAAFQGTPLAKSVIGPTGISEKFRASTVSQFMGENYQPYRFTIATTGDISHDKMVLYIQRNFGTLYPQPCYEPKLGPCRFTGSQIVYRDDSMPAAHIAVAFEAPGYTSPDYYPMLVAKHLLGSWRVGQVMGELNAARIAHQASDPPKLCFSYEPFYIAYQDVGLWGVYFVGDKMHLDDMWYVVQEALMHLCTTTTTSEAERAVYNTKLAVAKEKYNGVVNISRDLGERILYTLQRQSFAQVSQQLSDVKAHAIKAVGNKYLYDKCPVVAAMGPTETMLDYNRVRSGMYWLRL